jgi:hypothetical protein
MKTLGRLMVTAAAGLVVGVGGAPAVASATTTACDAGQPQWEIIWTRGATVTLRECDGDTTGAQASATGGELPVTGTATGVVVGLATTLLALGAASYLLTRGRRVVFVPDPTRSGRDGLSDHVAL